ncbi:hypothetical protein B0H11DRAFT_2234161 [Mycena galericulata]|nr:hypothetical protein B0H11DRAFT_2234161 [Mycena galericulata]
MDSPLQRRVHYFVVHPAGLPPYSTPYGALIPPSRPPLSAPPEITVRYPVLVIGITVIRANAMFLPILRCRPLRGWRRRENADAGCADHGSPAALGVFLF